MNNPFNAMMRQLQGGMTLDALLSQMAHIDPRAAQARRMTQGKTPEQLRQMVENIARERGISVEQIAQSLGLKMPK